jgi:hypothetical protein
LLVQARCNSFLGDSEIMGTCLWLVVKGRDLLVPFVSESREMCDIVLNVPCNNVCMCETGILGKYM